MPYFQKMERDYEVQQKMSPLSSRQKRKVSQRELDKSMNKLSQPFFHTMVSRDAQTNSTEY